MSEKVVTLVLREEYVNSVIGALSYVNHEHFQFLARNIKSQAEDQGVKFGD